MKQNVFLIIGVIGISSLLLSGILLWQNNKEAKTLPNDDGRFRFATAVGKKAPDFELADIEGNKITLSQLVGKNVILFFNMGLMCSTCVDQAVELNKLNTDDTVAFSIVVDSPKIWQKAEKDLPHLVGAKILFDSDAKVSRQYDTLVLGSSMKGMAPGHTYYLIDKEGIVRFTLDDPTMALRNEELVKALAKLK